MPQKHKIRKKYRTFAPCMTKIRVGIIFGGRSREREISFAGGRTVYDNLDKTLFDPIPLFADSFGNLVMVDWSYIYKGSIRDFYPPAAAVPSSESEFQLYAESLGPLTTQQQQTLLSPIGKPVAWADLPQYIDFAFLTLHGAFGEDGSVQGILQYLNIPYTASGILPSAIGMDKAFQRRTMKGGGFNVPRYACIKRQQWLQSDTQQRLHLFEQYKAAIGLPMIVKAANQGSSIGVNKVDRNQMADFEQAVNSSFFIKIITAQEWLAKNTNERQEWVRNMTDIRSDLGLPVKVGGQTIYLPSVLHQKLDLHFETSATDLVIEALDCEHTVIIEEFLLGKEFSCIVILNEDGNAIGLPPTEIRKGREIFDYRAKYLAGLSSKITPIDLPLEEINAIRHECERLFVYFGFHTYARIDGFITEKGIYLNDPNTTSGMLPSSFFFHQAAEIGLRPAQFLTYIIRCSLQERVENAPIAGLYEGLLQHLDAQLEQQHLHPIEKIPVGVIMGGYSSERHISVESGRNIYEKLASSAKYAPIPLFLTGNDLHFKLFEIPVNILLKDNADDIAEKIAHFAQHQATQVIKSDCKAMRDKYCTNDMIDAPREIALLDLAQRTKLVFIALHGRPGEDGTLQQSLEKYGIAYNGSGIKTSQITIDKYACNQLLLQHGFKAARQLLVKKAVWQQEPSVLLQTIETQFSYPLIAKPSDDGCSSAVKKIKNRTELLAYLNLIFRSDANTLATEQVTVLRLKHKEEFPAKDYFLIEELIEKGEAMHFLEVTGGLLTHHKSDGTCRYEMFEPSETLAADEVLSLEEKFLAGEGQNITPARYDKDPEIRRKIALNVMAELERAAQVLHIEGYARIDAFVKIYADYRTEVYIIEVNSLPGMTPATCIFHQCALNSYSPIAFIDAILEYGMERRSV